MSDHTTLHDVARLRAVLTARLPTDPKWVAWVEGVVEELAGADAVSVDGTPAQGIDRDTLGDELRSAYGVTPTEATLDAVLALVRPVEGVVLSREEAELAAPALRNAAARHATASGAAWHALAADLRALAARLEGVA
jgi:hypothetical protein